MAPLVQHSLSDGSLAFFTTQCPAGWPVERLVAADGRRARAGGCVREHQDGTRVADTESRSWHGRDRHVSAVMLAFAILTRAHRLADGPPVEKHA